MGKHSGEVKEMTERLYTRDEISTAINAGADLVCDDLSEGGLSDRDRDLINIVANAIGSALDNPGTTLDAALDANWEEEDGTPPREYIREWWDW